jgi:hypothetical protein
VVLGIDPGLQGAVALLRVRFDRDRPQLEALADVADMERVRELVREADVVVMESQQASPQMGVVSAFTLGVTAGRLWEAARGVKGVEPCLVAPSRWRASYGLAGGPGGKAGGMGLVAALLGVENAVSRHDEADAVLLAWWGWKNVIIAGLTAPNG